MESKKVKEIKKGLECCSTLMDNNATSEEQDNSCNGCPYRQNDRCSWNLDKDALSLINELEKENATKTYTIVNLLNKQEAYEVEKLKQFAEKLKEEFIKSANIQDSITAKKLFRDICTVKVDKVLKKFIKEK